MPLQANLARPKLRVEARPTIAPGLQQQTIYHHGLVREGLGIHALYRSVWTLTKEMEIPDPPSPPEVPALAT
ncbi:unnamed protein product [Tilletia controversa]|nr:unnamed protein product [Tilletia controversa]